MIEPELIPPQGVEFARKLDMIEGLVHIRPEPGRIPIQTTRRLIEEVQAGGKAATFAKERLIATRLMWMCDNYAERDEVKETGLDLADILQIGSLATIRAAKIVNSSTSNANTIFQVAVSRHMDILIREQEEERIREQEISDVEAPSGDRADVLALSAQNRIGPPKDMEDYVTVHATMRTALDKLSDREREVLEAWLGVDGPQISLKELAKLRGVTKQRMHQIKDEAFKKLITLIEYRPARPA